MMEQSNGLDVSNDGDYTVMSICGVELWRGIVRTPGDMEDLRGVAGDRCVKLLLLGREVESMDALDLAEAIGSISGYVSTKCYLRDLVRALLVKS